MILFCVLCGFLWGLKKYHQEKDDDFWATKCELFILWITNTVCYCLLGYLAGLLICFLQNN